MIHPGPWLNTTTESEAADMAPIHDLNQIQNRPWALQSLDSDYGKDFSPFVWIFAVQPEALTAQEGVIQHSWNHLLNRWQRFPISHISEANQVTRYDITEFQRLTNKVWKLKAANLARDHHLITRSSTYAQTLHQLRLENPYVEDAELRARTLKTLNFISNHAAASFSQIPAEQRQQILDTFIKWETNRIRAGLTGLDSSLHDALHSDTDDLFLKQFWTVVLPSLHHHFICRNPNCKKVVMSHHWATTVKHGARKQGHYHMPSMPGNIQTLCRCRPQRKTFTETKTVPCGQGPWTNPRHGHPQRSDLGTRWQTRCPLLPLPDGMARRDHRQTPQPPQDPHRGPTQRL